MNKRTVSGHKKEQTLKEIKREPKEEVDDDVVFIQEVVRPKSPQTLLDERRRAAGKCLIDREYEVRHSKEQIEERERYRRTWRNCKLIPIRKPIRKIKLETPDSNQQPVSSQLCSMPQLSERQIRGLSPQFVNVDEPDLHRPRHRSPPRPDIDISFVPITPSSLYRHNYEDFDYRSSRMSCYRPRSPPRSYEVVKRRYEGQEPERKRSRTDVCERRSRSPDSSRRSKRYQERRHRDSSYDSRRSNSPGRRPSRNSRRREDRRYERRRVTQKPLPYIHPERHEMPLDYDSDEEKSWTGVKEPEPPMIVHPIPRSALKFVTSNLGLLSEEAGCEIKILDDMIETCEYRNVQLKNFKSDISKAREVIDERIVEDQEYRQQNFPPVLAALFVPVPEEVRGAVFKKFKQGLEEISNYAGRCTVEVARSHESCPPIYLRGNPEDVLEAKAEINRRIRQKLRDQRDSVNDEIRIPTFSVGQVMGRRGETVRALKSSSGISHFELLPDDGDDYRIMEVSGNPQQVKLFKDGVDEIVNRDAPVDTDEGVYRVDLKPSQVGMLIGRGGANIREIREKTKVKLMMKKDGYRAEVMISGEKGNADYARHLIYVLIGELDRDHPYSDMSDTSNLSKVVPEVRTRSGKLISAGGCKSYY